MFLAAVRINNTDVVQMRKNDRNEKYKYKNKHKLAPNKKKKNQRCFRCIWECITQRKDTPTAVSKAG